MYLLDTLPERLSGALVLQNIETRGTHRKAHSFQHKIFDRN